MTNDPDVIERPCLDCDGNGFYLDIAADDDPRSTYYDCPTCGGSGVVLR